MYVAKAITVAKTSESKYYPKVLKYVSLDPGYFPAYKSKIPKTSLGLLFNFCETAKKYLSYVYLGNVTGSESQNTLCSGCGMIVISRYGNFIQKNGIDTNGNCTHCNTKIVIS